jgi:hypothetical protein
MILERINGALLAIAAAGLILRGGHWEAGAQIVTKEIPKFQVQPGWPTIPNGWTLGQVSDATVMDNNIWIIQRPRTVKTGVKTGPPVMEFDQAGRPGPRVPLAAGGTRNLHRLQGIRVDMRKRKQRSGL